MQYTPEEVGFILYNNRSVKGVVSHFIEKMRPEPFRLAEAEGMLSFCNKAYADEQTVAVDSRELDLESQDITVTPRDVDDCTQAVLEAHEFLMSGSSEIDWLEKRGITPQIADKWMLGSLKYIVEKHPECLQPLGITIHPMLKPILSDDVSEGGILIPLFEDGRLVNCTTRRISDVGKLKYTQACPDVDVWGLEDANAHEYWIAEGLFDAMAIRDSCAFAASVSSAMWSGPQLTKLLPRASVIKIFVDNDRVGLRSAAVLQKFFKMNGRTCTTHVSTKAKDAAEHFLEMKLTWADVKEIRITKDMIAKAPDMTFNFTKYLKNRSF